MGADRVGGVGGRINSGGTGGYHSLDTGEIEGQADLCNTVNQLPGKYSGHSHCKMQTWKKCLMFLGS